MRRRAAGHRECPTLKESGVDARTMYQVPVASTTSEARRPPSGTSRATTYQVPTDHLPPAHHPTPPRQEGGNANPPYDSPQLIQSQCCSILPLALHTFLHPTRNESSTSNDRFPRNERETFSVDWEPSPLRFLLPPQATYHLSSLRPSNLFVSSRGHNYLLHFFSSNQMQSFHLTVYFRPTSMSWNNITGVWTVQERARTC